VDATGCIVVGVDMLESVKVSLGTTGVSRLLCSPIIKPALLTVSALLRCVSVAL